MVDRAEVAFEAAINNEPNPNRAPERQQQNVPFNIVNIDIGNPFQHDPNLLGQNNLMNMRDRLFHAIYFKAAVLYAQIFPSSMRNALECFILLKAILFFTALVYIHVSFIKNPATCLQHVADWPRNGVLRVEIIPNLIEKRIMLQKYNADQLLRHNLQKQFYNGIGPQTEENYLNMKILERSLLDVGYQFNNSFAYLNETLMDYLTKKSIIEVSKSAVEKSNDYDVQEYIVEYALEYGYLRLSPTTRKRLRIPMRIVQLDPATNKCFGDKFSKMLLRSLLGYDDLLMASVRVLAEKEENKGYLRNVITGEHYRFVTMWWSAWTSYVTAFTIMTLFTFSISILLKFSHHQIFAFIVDLLQMLEFNGAARFPIAPLLTVILALVGMEAIMSEFFNDTTTAFYIIVIVWVADQYDAICCHTNITKRYWLRFFYLYLFSFYAYHYRFSGQNRSLALVSAWLFIQHSMFFFFHRYELPVILQQARLIARQNEQEEGTEPQQPQQQQQQQQQRRLGASRLVTRFFGRLQQQQQPQMPQQQHEQQRRAPDVILHILPLLRTLIARRGNAGNAAGGGPLEFIRRSLLARGWIAPVHVRVQVRNVQRLQIGSIQVPTNTVSNVTSNVPVNHNNSTISCNATTSSSSDLNPTHASNSLSTTSIVLDNKNEDSNVTTNNLAQIPVIATDTQTEDTNILETAETNLDCQLPLNLAKPSNIVATETVGNRKKPTGDDKNESKEKQPQQQQEQHQKKNNEIGEETETKIKNNSYTDLATDVVFDETLTSTTNKTTGTKLLPNMDSHSLNLKTTIKSNNNHLSDNAKKHNDYLENELCTFKQTKTQIQEELFEDITVFSEPNLKIDQLKSLSISTNASTSTIPFVRRDKMNRNNSIEKLELIDSNYSTILTRDKYLTNTPPISNSLIQLGESKENNNLENNNSNM